MTRPTKLVAAGGLISRGELAHRGRGTLGINLDNLKAVAPNATGQGKLMASFADTAGNATKTLAYRLANFTPTRPTTSLYGRPRGPPPGLGLTRVRVIGKYNLKNTATEAKENVFAASVGSRASVAVRTSSPPAAISPRTRSTSAARAGTAGDAEVPHPAQCTEQGQPLTNCDRRRGLACRHA